MAAKLKVIIELRDQLSKSVMKSGAAINHFTKRIKRSARALLSYQNVLKAIIAYQFIRLGKSVIGAAAKIEVFGKQLEMVSKNAAIAAKTLTKMREFARESPLETEDVIRAYVRLRAVGIDPTMKQMKTMGGVAVMMNREVSDVVGALISRHARTLREYGIELNATGKKAIVMSGNVRKEVTKDNASIRRAVLETWEQRFPNAIVRAANTFTAKLAIMRSGMFEFFAKLGKIFLPEMGNLVDEIDKKFRELERAVKKNKDKITKYVKKMADTIRLLYLEVKRYVGFIIKHWKKIMWTGAAIAIGSVVVKVAALAIAIKGLTIALASNPFGLAAIAISALVISLKKINNELTLLDKKGTRLDFTYLHALATGKKLVKLQELYNQKLVQGRSAVALQQHAKAVKELEESLISTGIIIEGSINEKIKTSGFFLNKFIEKWAVLRTILYPTKTPPLSTSEKSDIDPLGTGEMGGELKAVGRGKKKKPTDYAALARQANAIRVSVMKEGIEQRKALSNQEFTEKLAAIEALEEKLHNTVLIPWAQMKENLAIATGQKLIDINKEVENKKFADAVVVMDMFVEKTNQITNSIVDNMRIRREAALESDRERINSMKISNRSKEKMLDKAEAKNKERAKREKKMAIAMSFINAGASIIKLWANPGYPLAIPLTIMVGLLHTLELAKMKAQKLASGVYSARGGLTMVGERGPELMQMPGGARVYNASQTRNTMNSPITFNVNIAGDADEHAIGQLQDTLYQFKENLVDSIRYGYLNKNDFAGVM